MVDFLLLGCDCGTSIGRMESRKWDLFFVDGFLMEGFSGLRIWYWMKC